MSKTIEFSIAGDRRSAYSIVYLDGCMIRATRLEMIFDPVRLTEVRVTYRQEDGTDTTVVGTMDPASGTYCVSGMLTILTTEAPDA